MVDFKKELNSEQLKVVYEGDGSCLVLSGPGSGKTRNTPYARPPTSRVLSSCYVGVSTPILQGLAQTCHWK